MKRLGLHYRHFGTPLPLLKRLRGRFPPKNSAFWRRVEKVGLAAGPEAGAMQGLAFSYGVHPVDLVEDPHDWRGYALASAVGTGPSLQTGVTGRWTVTSESRGQSTLGTHDLCGDGASQQRLIPLRFSHRP